MESVLVAGMLLYCVMENMVNSMDAVIIPNVDLQKRYISNSIKHHLKLHILLKITLFLGIRSSP